jgi:hypothetical protein
MLYSPTHSKCVGRFVNPIADVCHGAAWTTKFGLVEVPAKVSQQGKYLLIESIPVPLDSRSEGK